MGGLHDTFWEVTALSLHACSLNDCVRDGCLFTPVAIDSVELQRHSMIIVLGLRWLFNVLMDLVYFDGFQ